ncbi:MAG TPA: aminotransferase class III-fold pyridoxal phosphate-dependent enzyme [Spirochaetes bacterium]|nr:aminotransferase class III-fold pyridoxal phosphate-dependent enzyme [Spirochaetota bacterium]
MDYEEIQRRRAEITRHPIYSIPAEKMGPFREKLATQCPKSRALFEEAKTMLPGGAQHMLVNKDPFPITVKTALGSKIDDIDGNRYLDYFMMAGPIILGHNYPPLIEKVTKVIKEEGIGTGWTSEWELKVVGLIKKHMPSVELFRYFQSGTEADMAAARVARVFTGKKKILKIGGTYHGWADQFVYDMHIPFTGKFESAGIPDGCYDDLLCTPPNDLDAMEGAFRKAQGEGGVAAVFIEPLGGESGAMPMDPAFPKGIRELCDRYEALFIFDEVVTAFRMGMGGAQAFYNVKPDLTVFGKILTHGFPSSGGVGGRKDIMECFVSGLQPGKGHAFVGGTMGANPISTSAGYWTIKYMEDLRAPEKAADMADKLTAGLNDIFEKSKFPFFAYNYMSIVHFETAAPIAVDIREKDGIPSALNRKAAVDRFATALLSEGIITKYGNRAFTCMAHTDEDIQFTLNAFQKLMEFME